MCYIYNKKNGGGGGIKVLCDILFRSFFFFWSVPGKDLILRKSRRSGSNDGD